MVAMTIALSFRTLNEARLSGTEMKARRQNRSVRTCRCRSQPGQRRLRRLRPRWRHPSDFRATQCRCRRHLGFPYWSLSKWAKLKVKNTVSYIGEFEKTLTAEARRHGADGVICGHIHHAVMHDDFGVRYVNCGDWVESCIAVAEHADGRFEIIHWAGTPQRRRAPVRMAEAA